MERTEEQIFAEVFNAQPQAEEQPQVDIPEEVEAKVEDTTPTEVETPPTETVPKVKIKYNSEEREIPLDEAAALAQKGLNYEKAVERAKQEARDTYIAEQGYTWNGKPITTEAEYKQALAEKELIEKYSHLPDEVVQELIEGKKFREQSLAKEKEQTEQQKQDAEFSDFIAYYKQVEGKSFDPDTDQLPVTVWQAHKEGTPLKQAYMEHKLNELQSTVKVLKQNEINKSKAPVTSVTQHGSTDNGEDDFIRGWNS